MIDVKFRIDGVNVEREDSKWKLPYGEDYYYVNNECKWSVVIDIDSDDMVNVLRENGYEVFPKEEE